jgi:hypothetical protein
MADRKPLIVLGVLALVAILLFVFGAFGAGRGASSTGMPEWASPKRSSGDQLTAADLRGSPGCDITGVTISFVGGCAVDVQSVTGGFPWEKATRRAILTAGPQPINLTVTLAGKTLRTDLDPGDDIRLTYTREGGTFVLTCLAVSGCVAVLSQDA